MWPWGHLAVAYLLYSYFTRRRLDRPPQAVPVLALAIGSQLPDLIDKPLAWGLGVLPSGRSLAHSLFFATAVISLLYLITSRTDRVELVPAFAVGYLSHLLADLPPTLFLGFPQGTEFLLWPLLDLHTFSDDVRLFVAPPALEMALFPFTNPVTYLLIQLVLFVVATVVWYRDGGPGLEFLPYVRSDIRTHRKGSE